MLKLQEDMREAALRAEAQQQRLLEEMRREREAAEARAAEAQRQFASALAAAYVPVIASRLPLSALSAWLWLACLPRDLSYETLTDTYK